jgi:hypothetical protein
MVWVAPCISLFLLIAGSAWAHAPYYTEVQRIAAPDGTVYDLKLLHGDGIIAGDPVRAVVVGGDGHAWAISPLALKLHISCFNVDGLRRCSVYDGLSSKVYEPDPEAWAKWPVIEQAGKPLRTAYPEDMGKAFGFLTRSATWAEILRFEASKITLYPIASSLALLWWIAIASLLTLTFWRMRQPDFWVAKSVIWAALRLGAAAGLLYVTLVAWAWAPYLAGFFAVSGMMCARVLTRPRQHAQEGEDPAGD